jgi:hypothetical protein
MIFPNTIGFHLSESKHAYIFAVKSLLQWTPKRHPESVLVVFSDCFLTIEALRECGLTKCKLFYDHWHLHAVVFPKVSAVLGARGGVGWLLAWWVVVGMGGGKGHDEVVVVVGCS